MKKYILTSLILLLAGVNSAWGQNVAKNGTTEYATLAEAISNATDGQTIVLLDNITGVNSPITINKTLTLDLNGKTLSGSADDMITVTAGSLTIDDSSTNHDGSISTTEKTAINFAGTKLTINNSTVEAVTADMYSGAMTICASAGAVEVNGGTVRGQSTSAYASARAIHMEGTSTSLTVNGGTIEAQCAASYGYAYALECTSGSNVAVNVTGGTINATTGGSRTPVIINNTSVNSTVAVSGGTFNQPIPAKQCAPGYIPTETSTGVYSVDGPYAASITANNVTTGYATLAEAITAAQAGQTITLLKDITLNNTVAINKGISIDGGNHTVTKADGVVFELTGSNDVTFTNLNIDVTGASGRAIQAGTDTESYSGTLTVTYSTLTAGQRGVSVYEPGGNINLAISNTTIQSTVADPTTTYVNADTRGIALWSYDGQSHNVTLEDTDIKGFSYCINVGGTGKINELTMTGGSTFGRAAINNHGKNGTFNLTNVEIHGLNNQTGPTEAFACIMDDTDAANNTYNLDNCTIIATLSDAAVSASNSNASEYLVDLRGKDSDIFITNGSTFTSNNADRSGLIEDYGRLDTNKGNTINFDDATYATFDAVYDFANVEGLNTTGNSLTYISEVYYYWTGQQAGGEYCSFAAPFTEGWLDNGEFIQLQRDVTLTSDITWQNGDGNSFYLELNGHSLSRDANALVPTYIYLNEGVTVYTDEEIDGLLLGLNNCPIAKFANTDATYKYKYTVVAEGSIAHINGTLYPSLAAAVAAAQDGDVITMIDSDYTSLGSGQEITINKSITITGPVDSDGMPLCIINGTSNNANYNDLFIKCTTGTVTISNVAFDGFGNDIASVIGQAPISVSTQNKKVVLDNVWISNINCEGVHINGGEFEITNCVIDCYKETEFDDYTKGICVVNEATGSITGTKIENVVCEMTNSISAGIELQGLGDVTIDGCTITATGDKAAGIAANSAENLQPGASTVAVSNCTVTSDYLSLYGDGEKGALLSVTSGTYNGSLLAYASNDSQGLSISGGTFDAPVPMEYLADGFICPSTTNNDGRYYIEQGEYVAQIDNYGYETLEAAFAAVEDGETITMLKDYTLTEPMNLTLGDKLVILDLEGNTLTGRTNLKSGDLTIENGTVAGGSQQALNVYGSADSSAGDYSVLTIANDVTVTADVWGVCMFGATAGTNGYGSVVNIEGTVHTTGNGAEGAVFVSGNLGNNIAGDMHNEINVTGTITSDTDAAIALNGNATVYVLDGAAITGNTAIAIKRGTLNVVEGATVHATGLSNIPPSGNMNGTEMSGAAVSMTNTYNNYGAMQVNISGGSFTSDHAMALFKEDDTYTNDAKYAVSGGIFNTAVPEEFCADGYVPSSITNQGFTQYTVAPGDFVAQIGDTKYTTLAAAVAAVPTNGTKTTITLLKDITLVNNVVVGGTFDGTNNSNAKKVTTVTNQNVILNLDGHTITGVKTLYLAGGSLNITGTGTIESTSQDVAPVGVRYVKTTDYPDLDYTSKRTLTIGKNVTLTGAQYGLNIFGTNEKTTANSIEVNVDGKVNGMLFVLGNISNADNNILINVNGTVDATNATGSEKVKTGIALCGNATVNVNDGATVSGESGIEVRAGNLTVNGGTITATFADYSYTANGSGTTTKGAAIAIALHGTKAATSSTILGGTLDGTKKIAVIDAQNNGLAGVTVIADDGFLTNSDTETVLPDGYYWLTNGDGTSSPAPNTAVAQIGNTLYSTLAAAVADVPTDGTATTITLLQNISLTDNVVVGGTFDGTNNSNAKKVTAVTNQNVTLDLNNHTITGVKTLYLAGGSLNITGTGTIESTSADVAPVGVRYVKTADYPDLDYTSKRTLTIGKNVTLTGAQYGLNIFGTNEKTTANSIEVNVDGKVNGMLFVLGNISNADNNILINVNGTVDATNATGSEKVKTGIALCGNATVNVNDGATVSGESGIEVRAGNLTVNGGTITATSADYSYAANGSGTTTKGAAIVVAQHGTVRPIDVTLNGGTLAGTKKIGVTDVNNNHLTDVSVVASNSFVANEADTEIPAGFLWVDNGNNTKKLVLAPARIGDTGYATLAEAIAAVQNGETIKLFADITLTDEISTNANNSFTLDFNGHNVIRNGNHVVLAESVSVLTNVAASQLFAAEGDNVVVESNSGNTDYPYEYSVKKSIANAGITISVNSATYTGALQTPTVTVKDGNNVLEAGTHYTISYKGSELKNANTYVEEIIITGIGDYAGTKTADFTINKRNINDVTVKGHSQPYTTSGYTTSQIAGLITLKYNDYDLVVSTDYTIAVDDTKTYKDSGTYPEVITLTAVPGGNFEGSRKVNFYIGGAKDITTSNIIATVVYNGSAQVPSEATVTVKDGNTNQPLTLGTDFTLEYYQNYEYINAQTYENAITIVGIGTYYGTKTVDYIITPKDISGCIINNSTPFTGAVIDPATVVTVKDGNTTLSSTDDYTLTVSQGHTYQNPQTYGNAITITGKGNYTGTKTMDFIITQTDAINLATAAVVISKQTYTGADLKPTAATTTVTVNGAALDPANYTFSFVPEGDNFYKDAKIYSNAIIITGKGGTYYGTAVGNYIIEPRDMNDGITVTTTNLSYLNTEQNITVEVKYGDNVIDETNYTFTPTKIFEAGHYDVTVTAVENSNLVGSTTADQWVFKSLEGDYADDFTVEPDPIPTQNYTGQEICPTIIVKDKDRVMTIADATSGDYSITYSNNIDPGEATITISGTYAYSGTITKTFKIITEYFVEGDFTYHHAQDGEEVSIGKKENGNNVLATTATGKVTVPETITHEGNTFTVTGIEENALGSPDITGITLPASIADVADNAFNGADNLRYIDLSTATAFVPSTLQRNITASPFNGVPKQTLIYLNGTTFQGENYVYKPGSGNQYFCEKFTIYDDLNGSQTGFDNKDYQWAFENPHQFTAYTIENTRMLSAGKHYTICLPYSIAIPAGTKAYTLDATSSQLFGFQEVTGTLAAFTPYVLIPTKSGQQLSATNTVVPAFEDDADGSESKLNGTTKGTFTLYGTMRYMDGDDATGKYIMQYNGGNPTWKQITSSPGFNNNPNKACILPMRAYIINNTSGSREYMGFSFTNLDGSTTIYNIDDMMFDSEDAIYDLKGRKVQNVLHGPYIINGKKILVK